MAPFFAVNALFFMAASFAHPVTPTFFKSLRLGDDMFGYAIAAMMSMNFLLSPFWAKMSAIFSSRVALLVSCFGYAAGQVLFLSARTEWQVLFARTFAGVFSGGIFVGLLTYAVNRSEEGNRGAYLALGATVQSVAGAFGFFVGGMLGSISVYAAMTA
jgi:DHA1 family multidrug resistance protein-like MFS transporter